MYIFFFLAKIDQLLRNVASITAELAVTQEQVTLLSRKRLNEDSDDVTAEVKTLNTIDEIKDFEDTLKSEEEFSKAVCSFPYYQ